MKKNVHFAALFSKNLALITYNAPSSVNPSIGGRFRWQNNGPGRTPRELHSFVEGGGTE